MGMLEGKTAVVVGVANDKSVAAGIARKLHAEGANIILTVQNEKTLKFAAPVIEELNAQAVVMDLMNEDSIANAMAALSDRLFFDGVDVLVHSVAFAPAKALNGRVIDVEAADFALTMGVSVHTFLTLISVFEHLLNENASIMTVSYLGGVQAVDGYGIMGVAKAALESAARYAAAELGGQTYRVNVLSPGPISTRAASGISKFSGILEDSARKSPVGNVTIDDVGDAAVALAVNKGITGQVLYVDGGYSAVR